MTLDLLRHTACTILDRTGGSGSETCSPTSGLLLLRSFAPTPLTGTIYEPVLCVVLQGEKQVVADDSVVTLRPGDALVVSHDMPVMSTITRAHADEPYVACILGLDLATLRELRFEVDDATGGSHLAAPGGALSGGRASAELVDALRRYVTLDHDGSEGRALGPTIRRETYLRLLLDHYGATLRELLDQDSNAALVARAIARIRRDFTEPLAIPDLASELGMSTSSLHDHFRRVTSTTPLRYQKELRLQEARRMLTSGPGAVTSVAAAVGYASPSQFSREYARRFGTPPSRHATADATSP
jgi:AraC-like DNA-binding protein